MPLPDQSINNNCSRSFKSIHLKKKTVLWIYLILGWLMIALVLMTATGGVSYDEVKYFFWMVPFLTAVLYLLYVNKNSSRMSKEEEIKLIFALIFTFICLIIAFFVSIFLGY
jgi:amino acid transporter